MISLSILGRALPGELGSQLALLSSGDGNTQQSSWILERDGLIPKPLVECLSGFGGSLPVWRVSLGFERLSGF